MAVQLLDWPFVLAGAIEAERDDSGAPATYTAHERFANPKGLALNKWGAGPFVRLRPPPLPKVPGVYAIVHASSVLYIGRARDSLFVRWGRRGYSVIDPRNCYVGGQSTNCHVNHLIGDALAEGWDLELWIHETPVPDEIETTLRRSLHPIWNIQDA